MRKYSAQKGFTPVILVVAVIAVIIAILVASGALKFNGKISKSESAQPEQSNQVKEESTPKTKTYTNDGLGLSLEYPENWSIKENPAAGVVVAFGSPKESTSDQFVDNINISTADLSSKPDMTLTQTTDSWLKQTESATSFNLIERNSTTLGGEPAEQLIYAFSNQDKNIKGMVVITLKNKTAYIVTYSAEQTSYDKFVNVANTITSSLKIK